MTAQDAGATVLMLEKNPEGGGSSRVSSFQFLAPVPEDEDLFYEYLKNLDRWGQVPDDMARAAAAEFVKIEEWLIGLGFTITGITPSSSEANVPGGESVRIIWHEERPFEEGWKIVARNIEDRNIEVLYQTPGKRLIQTSEGDIIGVVADAGGEEIYIKAKRAVILTCGGYEFDDQMQKDYVPGYPILYFGNPTSTGDGVKMAQAAGADLWHMTNTMMLGSAPALKVPDYESPVELAVKGKLAYVFVDKHGRRYMNEDKPARHGQGWNEQRYFDLLELTFPRIPWYVIFDEQTTATTKLFKDVMDWCVVMEGYRPSEDNSVEIEKGWILKADTIQELGEQILALEANDGKMDPSVLEETIAAYNGYCGQGEDPEFGRPADTLLPLTTPPFYAAEVYPGSRNTQGGPRRDANARIIDVWGKPIPRLYSAGELGSMWAGLYQGGGNVSDCVAFGRIAGRNAGAEEPWE